MQAGPIHHAHILPHRGSVSDWQESGFPARLRLPSPPGTPHAARVNKTHDRPLRKQQSKVAAEPDCPAAPRVKRSNAPTRGIFPHAPRAQNAMETLENASIRYPFVTLSRHDAGDPNRSAAVAP